MTTQHEEQRGFVVVWFALMLTVLIGFAGLSLDLGQTYLRESRDQNAADAAALAAAPYLPNDPDTAHAVAEATLSENDISLSRVTYLGPDPNNDAFMMVKLRATVTTVFMRFVGVDTLETNRIGIAHMNDATPMGSRMNVLGKEPATLPAWSNTGEMQSFWLQQNSAGYSKAYADRWNTQLCDVGNNPLGYLPDKCTNSKNDEYQAGGPQYLIRIPQNATGYLAVEAYDPLFAPAAADCSSSRYTGLPAAWAALPSARPFPAYYGSYATDPSLCVGDSGGPVRNTTFSLWTPSSAPGGSQAIDIGITCRPRIYTPLPITTAASWATTLSAAPSMYSTTPESTFHQWSRVCTLPLGGSFPGGTYILHTDIENSGATQLHSRYAVRAAIMSNPTTVDVTATDAVNVYGPGRMSEVMLSDTGGSADFYFAKVAPSSKSIRLQSYDFGDSGIDTIRFYWADGSPMTSSCTMSWDDGAMPALTSPSCTFTIGSALSDQLQSRIINFDITFGTGLHCNPATSTGCWLKMKTAYRSASVGDGASFSVEGTGDGLRLYEPGTY